MKILNIYSSPKSSLEANKMHIKHTHKYIETQDFKRRSRPFGVDFGETNTRFGFRRVQKAFLEIQGFF